MWIYARIVGVSKESPEIFQLFGHFCSLQALNILSVTSLGVFREQIWTGSVLWKRKEGSDSMTCRNAGMKTPAGGRLTKNR